MNIDISDLITLSDKNEYVVVNKVNFNNKVYYYIADINNQSNLKFCYIDDDELVEIKDKQLIMKLIPLFKDSTKI